MVTATTERPPIRVMIVDDHKLVRQGVKDSLAGDDSISIIGEAETAREAIRLMSVLRPDVMLLDIRLPDGTGIEVAQTARQNVPGTKVLVLSAYDDDHYVTRLARVGVAGYLTKGVSSQELLGAVHNVADGWKLFAPSVVACMNTLLENRENGLPRRASGERPLTAREQQVLRLLARGLRNIEIATSLQINVKTVEAHVENILVKLRARNRTEAVSLARARGWFCS